MIEACNHIKGKPCNKNHDSRPMGSARMFQPCHLEVHTHTHTHKYRYVCMSEYPKLSKDEIGCWKCNALLMVDILRRQHPAWRDNKRGLTLRYTTSGVERASRPSCSVHPPNIHIQPQTSAASMIQRHETFTQILLNLPGVIKCPCIQESWCG